MTTLRELIQNLEILLEDDPDLADAPVLFAHQPRWPLQCAIDGPHVVKFGEDDLAEAEAELAELVAIADDEDEGDAEDIAALEERIERLRKRVASVVYLCEGSWRPRINGEEASPYAPRAAFGEE